jgi:hypothetical protein
MTPGCLFNGLEAVAPDSDCVGAWERREALFLYLLPSESLAGDYAQLRAPWSAHFLRPFLAQKRFRPYGYSLLISFRGRITRHSL